MRLSSLTLLTLLLLLSACDDPGEAHFEANLSVTHDCLEDNFPFDAKFFAASYANQGAFIKMQENGVWVTAADGLFLTLSATEHPLTGEPCPKISSLVEGPVDVGPQQCARAYFRFRSCGRDYINPHVMGTLTLDHIGFEEGDEISGRLSGELVNLIISETEGVTTYATQPLGDVDGDFSFEVKVGPAYQGFSTPAEPEYMP